MQWKQGKYWSERKSQTAGSFCAKMFLNVIKLEAKVTDSSTKLKGKVISEETAGKVNILNSECKNKPERTEKKTMPMKK